MTRQEIIDAARQLLGTPWQHQGRVPGIGIDCAGVIIHILKLNGIDYDVQGYGRQPDGNMTKHADACLRRIRKEDVQPGDVLVFRVKRLPQHIAILTDKGILHANERGGGGLSKVVETGLSNAWRAHIVAAYAFPWVA